MDQETIEAVIAACQKEKEIADRLIEQGKDELKAMEQTLQRVTLMSQLYQRELERLQSDK